MRRWTETLDLSDVWDRPDNVDPDTHARKVAKVLAERIEEKFGNGEDLYVDVLADDMAAIAEDEMSTADEFDNAMNLVHDWADANGVWVKTFL